MWIYRASLFSRMPRLLRIGSCDLPGDGLFCDSTVRVAYGQGCTPCQTSMCQSDLCFKAE
jgi:hypothetical protein